MQTVKMKPFYRAVLLKLINIALLITSVQMYKMIYLTSIWKRKH